MRDGGRWRAFLARHHDQLLARDCFTAETLFLGALYVLFFPEFGTRWVYFVGCTAPPTAAWVAQQARNLCWTPRDEGCTFR